VLIESEQPCHEQREHDSDEGRRNGGNRPLENQDQHKCANPHDRRRAVGLVSVGKEVPQAVGEMIALDRDAGELAELADEQRHAKAGQVADQRGTREEVGNEAEAQRRRDQQHDPDDHGQRGSSGHVFIGAGDRHGRQAGGGEGRRPRIGPDRQMPRRTEQRVERNPDDDGLKRRTRGQAGDRRVRHALCDQERADRQSTQHVTP
jgi:hypothetical protein